MKRRAFIKLTGAGLVGAVLPQPLSALAAGAHPPEDHFESGFVPLRRGRVIASSVAIWDQIETPRAFVKNLLRDEVILLGEERDVPGTGSAYNSLWYRTRGGWVHSAWIQPMEFHDRPAIYREASPNGFFWIEVIEPKTAAYKEPALLSPKDYDYYYGSVYLVDDVAVDERGGVWYRTYDEYTDKEAGIEPTHHWVQAHQVRRVHESEFTAIRPEVADKRIRVDLKAQPSRHMRASEAERNTDGWFDLPGVPWVTFFTREGIGFHGTYWHNDYGAPRSHGCVNAPIPVAKFIYRWTFPTAPYTDSFVRGDVPGMNSTTVEVV